MQSSFKKIRFNEKSEKKQKQHNKTEKIFDREKSKAEYTTGNVLTNRTHFQQQLTQKIKADIIQEYEITPLLSTNYSHGKIVKNSSDSFFTCIDNDSINVLNNATGAVVANFRNPDGSKILAHTLTNFYSESQDADKNLLIFSTEKFNVYIFSLKSPQKELRVVKASNNKVPVVEFCVDATNTICSMGYANGAIRVYDLQRNAFISYSTSLHQQEDDFSTKEKRHNFRIHKLKTFVMCGGKIHYLVSLSVDGLKIWNLQRGTLIQTITASAGEGTQNELVTDVVFTNEQSTMKKNQVEYSVEMVFSSRDTTISIYRLKLRQAIPTEEGELELNENLEIEKISNFGAFEGIEGILLFPKNLTLKYEQNEQNDDILISKSELANHVIFGNVFKLVLEQENEKITMKKNSKDFENLKKINQKILDQKYLICGGSFGIIKIFDLETSEIIFQQTRESENPENSVGIIQLLDWFSKSEIFVITDDGNFHFHSLKSSELSQTKQILGFSDAILGLSYNSKYHSLAIAPNSDNLLLLDLKTRNCEIVKNSHDGVIMSLDLSNDQNYLISASKDKSVKCWKYCQNSDQKLSLEPIGISIGHSKGVSALKFAPKSNNYFISISEDKSMKKWSFFEDSDFSDFLTNLKKLVRNDKKKKTKADEKIDEKRIFSFKNVETLIAHKSTINCLAISPNDDWIATGSSDRTLKIFDKNLKVLATLHHFRPVFSCDFSPVEKWVATGAADSKIRIWSLAEISNPQCIKVLSDDALNGFTIIQTKFINFGKQLFTTTNNYNANSNSENAANLRPLIKVWTVKEMECIATYDTHSDSVWSVEIGHSDHKHSGRLIFTGGEDSKLMSWRDITPELRKLQTKQIDTTVIRDAKLKILIKERKYHDALKHSIALDMPKQTFTLLQNIFLETSVEDSEKMLENVILGLTYTELTYLLQYVVDWNTNSKFSLIGQEVLKIFNRKFDPNFWSFDYEKSIDSLLGYSNRHLKRINGLLQKSYLVDYIHQHMVISQQKEKEKKEKMNIEEEKAQDKIIPEEEDEEDMEDDLSDEEDDE